MTLALYPTVRGLGWPVTRTLEWDTLIQKVSSGKELRLSYYTFPINHWLLTYNYLKDNPADPYNPYASFPINGNFLSGVAGWATQSGAAIAQDTASPFAGGGYSAKVTGSVSQAGAHPASQLSVSPGQPVFVSAWTKSDGIFVPQIWVRWWNSSGVTGGAAASGTVSTAWAPISISGMAPAGTIGADVYIGRGDATGGSQSGWFADVSLSLQPGAQNVSGYTDLQLIEGFYNSQQGRFGMFLFNDPNDNFVSAQQIAIGDGTATQFQLVRTRGGFTEPVQAPQTWNIYLNGTLQSSGFSVSSAGVLSFGTAPGSGVIITADLTYCWNARFDDDSADFEQFMYQLWRRKQVKLVQVKL